MSKGYDESFLHAVFLHQRREISLTVTANVIFSVIHNTVYNVLFSSLVELYGTCLVFITWFV